MKKLNGYYYCISYSDGDYELYSVAVFTREEVVQIAHKAGARVYLVKYRNSVQQGRKKRIPTT